MRLLGLVLKQVWRHPLRTLLTGSGVAVAMFLFCAVEAMREGVERATQVSAEDTVLVVYRENRYCPFTSRLPQYYQPRIEALDGVVSAVPMRILVSNCRASLDVVTFRGVPEEAFVEQFIPNFEVVAGRVEDWSRRSDAALVGESLASRRGVQVGDRFSAAGITVWVAGIVRSTEPQDQNVAYTHLSFIQESSTRGGTGGVVTQFNVKVAAPGLLEPVAAAIDAEFARDPDPTATRPEKAFVAQAAGDILGMVRFASWMGWGALAAVFALVANAIVLAVQDRIREHAIFQTLGYSPRHIATLVLLEGCLLGVGGGSVGAVAALVLTRQRLSLSMEGLNMEIASDPGLIAVGLALSIGLGLLASVVPAFRAARREIADSFRAVCNMKLLPFDYAVRNLGRSPVRLGLGLFGSALVALLVIAAGSFVRGMNSSLEVTGGEHNVLLLGAGSEESIERSEIPLRAASIAASSLSGVKERLGERYVSPEIHAAFAVKTSPDQDKGRLTVVRGVRPVAFLVHPQLQIIEGRAPEAGSDEILVGSLVAAKLGLETLAVGASLWIDGRPWNVCGIFRAARTVMDAEIWMPLPDLQVVAQRDNLSCVVLTLDPQRASFGDVEIFALQRLDLELVAMRESDYYQALAEFFGPIRFMVLVTAALIALGGILGGLNTMYAAFASRVREVGTLQVIGYGRAAVAVSILQESIITTAAGALFASAVGAWLLDGIAVNFSMGAFGLVVDAPVIALGLASGLLLGGLGALPPALRCLRLPVNEALRA